MVAHITQRHIHDNNSSRLLVQQSKMLLDPSNVNYSVVGTQVCPVDSKVCLRRCELLGNGQVPPAVFLHIAAVVREDVIIDFASFVDDPNRGYHLCVLALQCVVAVPEFDVDGQDRCDWGLQGLGLRCAAEAVRYG